MVIQFFMSLLNIHNVQTYFILLYACQYLQHTLCTYISRYSNFYGGI